jgi:acylphosphatase
MNEPSQVDAKRRLHAIVHGRVQGVNFRAYTARRGRELGLRGWVRNQADGTVEALAEGTQEMLDAFFQYLHIGPPSASVIKVDAIWGDASGDLEDFTIRYF